jgi:phosphotriesterase-related protein
VLAHEHLLIDITCWLDPTHPLYERLRDERVRPEVIDLVRQHPFACPDNVVLDDSDTAVAELGPPVVPEGVHVLVVDVTPDGVGRDLERLAEISRRSGVDVVTGCGPYVEPAWDPTHDAPTASAVAAGITALFRGDRPPAVIGEIGTSSPMTPNEREALRGAASIQREVGAPLYVHVDPWSPCAEEALDVVADAGGDLSRTVICHMDITATRDLDAVVALLERGCWVALDIWGDEDGYGGSPMPTDADRLTATLALMERGFGSHLLHSQDVCTKSQLTRFGGPGYGHLWRSVRPRLLAAGLTEEQVHQQLAGNPLAMLRGDQPSRD